MSDLALAAGRTGVPAAQVDSAEEIQESASSAWETVAESAPRVGIALVVLLVSVLVGRALRPVVRARLQRRRTPSFARVFARLTSAGSTIAGVILAVTIVFPSVRPVDVIAGAGIFSIAVGFAFQDILQNVLAGVLLLFRDPFRAGDQIEVGDVVGTVEEINIRETIVTTFDGRRVLVPNIKVYADVIRVQTANERIRASFEVGIAYENEISSACELAATATRAVAGVAHDPAPEVLVVGLGESTVNLEVLFWCDAHQLDMRRARSRAIEAVKGAFDEHGIEMPSLIIALQATTSFAASLHGRAVTPGGSVAATGGADGGATAPGS
ncbi:MAG: mechanosensitive ion channel family protein [Acidimicrobiia bacterium]|nr:mechanosensitive ion channel family protein [Acidimicrobiia bacterium]